MKDQTFVDMTRFKSMSVAAMHLTMFVIILTVSWLISTSLVDVKDLTYPFVRCWSCCRNKVFSHHSTVMANKIGYILPRSRLHIPLQKGQSNETVHIHKHQHRPTIIQLLNKSTKSTLISIHVLIM